MFSVEYLLACLRWMWVDYLLTCLRWIWAWWIFFWLTVFCCCDNLFCHDFLVYITDRSVHICMFHLCTDLHCCMCNNVVWIGPHFLGGLSLAERPPPDFWFFLLSKTVARASLWRFEFKLYQWQATLIFFPPNPKSMVVLKSCLHRGFLGWWSYCLCVFLKPGSFHGIFLTINSYKNVKSC